MTLLISNARAIFTDHADLPGTSADSILIDDGAITAVGHGLEAPPGAERLDASGCVVLPGLVNAHHHMFQSLTRAQGYDDELFGWLSGLWPVWTGHDAAWQRAAVAVASAELLLSGCTTTVDHHYLPPVAGDKDALTAQVETTSRLGIRLVAAIGSMDIDDSHGGLAPSALCEPTDAFLARAELAIARFHDAAPGSRVQIALAPCHPLAVTSGLARSVTSAARHHGVRLHTHTLEAWGEEQATVAATGMRTVELLAAWDMLGPDVWLAHCVHLSDQDIEVLAATGTSVALCPSSNLRLGSGIARARDLLEAGVTVALGVDGSASNDSGNMLAEARQLFLASRARGLAEGLTVREALRTASAGGAAALGRSDLGQIAVGRRADLALFDTTGLPSVGTEQDPVAGLLLSPPGGARHVLVEGDLVVREGQLVRGDLNEIIATAHEVIRRGGSR